MVLIVTENIQGEYVSYKLTFVRIHNLLQAGVGGVAFSDLSLSFMFSVYSSHRSSDLHYLIFP